MTDKEFVEKTINWFYQTYISIYSAGGDPVLVIEKFPYELMETMIRNDLYITFKEPSNEN